MADYYPVLARAVSGLPSNDPQARRDLYARARKIVSEQLRGRGQGAAAELTRERAALEAAIRRVEAEAKSGQARMNGKAHATPTRRARAASASPATAAPEQRAENTGRSLSKILQAVQSDEANAANPFLSQQKSTNGTGDPVPTTESKAIAPVGDRSTPASSELGEAASSVGAMLLGLTYVVAALAFTGATYIRCIVWVYQGVISYPILLGVMALTLALFIVPAVTIFRKPSSLPTVDSLLRFIYSRSRRVL